MGRSVFTFYNFYLFRLKNRGVWRSAISVIADWPIFLSPKYRNAPYKKKYFIFESLDVAFRYSRCSGVTHQNVKIKAMCTVHISQIFLLNIGGFFMFMCDKGGWAVLGMVYTGGGGVPIPTTGENASL